jgi:hypothetical protein
LRATSQTTALDPAAIERKIAASKAEEVDLVRATVEDPKRAEQTIDLLAERERLLERIAGQIVAYREQMAALNADYHAERSDFEALLADFNRIRNASQRELVADCGTTRVVHFESPGIGRRTSPDVRACG